MPPLAPIVGDVLSDGAQRWPQGRAWLEGARRLLLVERALSIMFPTIYTQLIALHFIHKSHFPVYSIRPIISDAYFLLDHPTISETFSFMKKKATLYLLLSHLSYNLLSIIISLYFVSFSDTCVQKKCLTCNRTKGV